LQQLHVDEQGKLRETVFELQLLYICNQQ